VLFEIARILAALRTSDRTGDLAYSPIWFGTPPSTPARPISGRRPEIAPDAVVGSEKGHLAPWMEATAGAATRDWCSRRNCLSRAG